MISIFVCADMHACMHACMHVCMHACTDADQDRHTSHAEAGGKKASWIPLCPTMPTPPSEAHLCPVA